MSALTRTLSGVLGSVRPVLRQGAVGSAGTGEVAPAASAASAASAGAAAGVAGPLAAAILIVWASTAWIPASPESPLLGRAGVDRDTPPAPVIVIVFQAADCAVAREDLLVWNGRDVRVQGVVVGAVPDGPRGLEVVIGDAGLTFPVSHRSEGSLEDVLRSVGYDRTPILLAFDAVGRLREAGPLTHFAEEQAAQVLLERLISMTEM